jgi:hypothetical protein
VRINKPTNMVLLALLLGALGAPGLKAQSDSPYSYLFKIRAGLTAGDIQKTHFDNKVMGIGAEVRYAMPAIGGAITGELAFEYVPGRNYETEMFKALNLPPAVLRSSFDNRKEGGAGLNLRFAYSAPFPPLFGPWLDTKGFEWFAGLGIDRFKVRSEVTFFRDLRENPNTTAPQPGQGQYDGNNHNLETSKIAPGVFAGIKYRHSQYLGFEMSLRNFGMWHYEFVPASYYSTNPSDYGTGKSSTGTSRGWALEFAISAKI